MRLHLIGWLGLLMWVGWIPLHAQMGTVDEPQRLALKRYELQATYTPQPSAIEKQDIAWQEMGPFTKPKEGFVGGKAIPVYAAGRGNGIGRVNALFVHPRHPSVLYACSATGGVFISHDKGKNWKSGGTDQLVHAGVATMALHPRKSAWWIAATGDSENNTRPCDTLVLTCDGGKSFQSIVGADPATKLPLDPDQDLGNTGFFVRKLWWDVASPNRVWLVSNKGLWLCENLDINRKGRLQQNPVWKRVLEGDFFDFIAVKRGKQFDWYVAGEKIFFADDVQRNWTPLAETGLDRNQWGEGMRWTMQAHRYLPNFLFVNGTAQTDPNGHSNPPAILYLVDIKKQEWQRLHSSVSDDAACSNMRPRAWAVHPINPNAMVMADVHPVYFSNDGGKSFKKSVANQLHDDVHCFVFSPDGRLIFAAHDGGVAMSDDGGVQWSDRSNGLACANIFHLDVHPRGNGQMLYGAYDTGINVLSNDAHVHAVWGDGFDCAFVDGAQHCVASIQYGRFFRTDSIGRFEEGKMPNSRSEWKTNMAVHPLDNKCIAMAGTITKRSMDGGISWASVANNLPDTNACVIYDVFLSPFAKGIAIVYGMSKSDPLQSRLFFCSNFNDPNAARVKWQELPILPAQGLVTGIVFHPIANQQFWLLTSNVSTSNKFWFFDGGVFNDESANLGNARCESIILNTAQMSLIIGSDHGVFCRSLHNNQFRCYTGYPGCQVKALSIDYVNRHLYVGTFGRGIWRCDLQWIEAFN